MQNTSHAVMSQRSESKESLDNFPTPPWATRALLKHILADDNEFSSQSCLEPACGQGHMVMPLREYFGKVDYYDVDDYGFGPLEDFLTAKHEIESYDWVITNPPFNLAEQFIAKALPIARKGVAMLTRTVFLEGIGRYERIFSTNPVSIFAQFSERVPMVKGRLDRKASTATAYAWLIWEKDWRSDPLLKWIPPCRKELEKDLDYNLVPSEETAIVMQPQRTAASSAVTTLPGY